MIRTILAIGLGAALGWGLCTNADAHGATTATAAVVRLDIPCHPVAHRGFHNAHYDENTAASARRSGELDAPPEADARVSAVAPGASTGGVFAMHDDTVNRTTDGEGRIEDKTIPEVRALATEPNNQPVPSMREWLRAAADNRFVIIEPKDYGDDETIAARWRDWGFAALVNAGHDLGVTIYFTGTNGVQNWMRDHYPGEQYLWRVDGDEPTPTVGDAQARDVKMIQAPNPSYFTASQVAAFKAAKIKMGSRNADATEWPLYFERGINFLQTNQVIGANQWCRTQA